MMMRLLTVIFLVLLGIAGWMFVVNTDSGEDGAPATGPEPVAADGDTIPEARVSSAVPVADSTVPDEDRLLCPDGTWVRVLNGARGAQDLSRFWPREIPYAAIIGTEIDQSGNEWYVHADGSKSTTLMRLRQPENVMVPITMVANPQKTAPREPMPGEAEANQGAGQNK